MDLTIGVSPIIDVEISSATPEIEISLTSAQHTYKKYDGEYDVTPTVDGQTLKTANKLMEQDVNIRAIPFYEVSNAFDGETVYIAKEI